MASSNHKRKRQANQPGGPRPARIYVRVTGDEYVMLMAKAELLGVTAPRLMVEAALSSAVETATERRNAMEQLYRTRRLLAGVANNLNQLARWANASGEFPGRAEGTRRTIDRLSSRLDEAIDGLAQP